MHEILEVVADATRAVGAVATMHVGSYPTIPERCAYVVIPHEYFVVTEPNHQPTAEQRSRTIALCVEHPGNATFEVGARHAAGLGAVMDINADSTAALRAAGLAAHRFTLGYSPRWDLWGGDAGAVRPIDVTYLGTTDVRRDFLLARQSQQLSTLDCRLLIPPHEPMTRERPDFLMGTTKLRHLARSKILLNLHRGGSRALEWVRVLEAMCNGCVTVSESSVDFMPLVPGRHIAFARPVNATAVAVALLRHPDRLAAIRDEAYEFSRTLDMQGSAQTLVEIGEWLIGSSARAPVLAPHTNVAADHAASHGRPEPPQPAHGLPELSGAWASLAEPMRELQARLIAAVLVSQSRPEITQSAAEDSARIRIRALLPQGDGDRLAGRVTRRSLEAQDVPVSASTARAGLDGGPLSPADLFSRGSLLNALLHDVSEEFLLVIGPGHELYRSSVGRLAAALDADSSADAAFGMMADVVDGHLWNALPLERDRLARRAYLSAPFLIRRQALTALGGFAEEAALVGYEYHEFWCRFARSGRHAVFIQQILGRGRPAAVPDLSIARVAPHLTWAALQPSLGG